MNSAESTRNTILVGHANTFHDSSIALMLRGEIFAESIERHMQCKRALGANLMWYSSPIIRQALARAGAFPVTAGNVLKISTWDPVSYHEHPVRDSAPYRIQAEAIALEPVFDAQLLAAMTGQPASLRKPKAVDTVSLESTWLPHHLAHAANAVYTSPFDSCAVMVLDGNGETTGASFYHFSNGRFEPIPASAGGAFDGSLGNLYSFVTRLCGFSPVEGEEWKVMGLAAYGVPNHRIYDFFKQRLEQTGLDLVMHFTSQDWAGLERVVGGFRGAAEPVRKAADLAHNFQRAFEEVVIDYGRALHRLGCADQLAYAGGCALNSSANGKLARQSGFSRLHVPSAPADDGNALGAVLYHAHSLRGDARSLHPFTPYLGTRPDPGRLEAIAQLDGCPHVELADDDLYATAANLLAAGRIIGWMQGPAEFGPRALGNRSILADPRSADMRDRINACVKFREDYRPLAPSILHEYGAEFFEHYAESPYMERALTFHPHMRPLVPAVVHVDGTGRLQSITRSFNPRFYDLISAFHALTGIPLVLNTSFNVMGRPIVHSIDDALTVFHTTGLDALFIENHLFVKRACDVPRCNPEAS